MSSTPVTFQAVPPTSPDDSLLRLETFLSPYTGIVRETVELMYGPGEARLASVGATLASGGPVIGNLGDARGGGTHSSRAGARAAALGEAVERYSASFVLGEQLVVASARELGDKAVDPRRFALFHEQQHRIPGFPFGRFTPDTRIRWARGFSVPDGIPAFVPAQLTYLTRLADDEPQIGYTTSNGVACAATLEEAILGGLCELIERDAFMLTWYARLSLPRLTWSSTPELAELDRRLFAPSRRPYAAIDLSVFFGVPAALGVVRGAPGERAALAVGAGCASTIVDAWRKALSEAFAVHRWLREVRATEPERQVDNLFDIRDFDDHMLFYADESRARHAAFLDGSPERREAADVPPLPGADVLARIREITRRLAAASVSAYAVDVTAPDVRASGLRVARVICPELCPLDVFGSAPYLGGRRILHAAHEAGLLAAPLSVPELNPCPHPFP